MVVAGSSFMRTVASRTWDIRPPSLTEMGKHPSLDVGIRGSRRQCIHFQERRRYRFFPCRIEGALAVAPPLPPMYRIGPGYRINRINDLALELGKRFGMTDMR
jgi:hypothetical protein